MNGLADRIAAGLTSDPLVPHLDDTDYLAGRPLTDAAVLIAFTDRAEPGVILTQRPEWLRRHAGQVAFPGGRIDANDADPVAAALREAEEEIALPPHQVSVVGSATPYLAGSGFHITPVLAVVPPDLPLVPHAQEVAAIFEVPARVLFDPARSIERDTPWHGSPRRYREIIWQDRRIWGVTAGIIHNLAQRLPWAR